MEAAEIPASWCLFDKPVPTVFSTVVFDRKHELPRGARVAVDGVVMFAGLLRSTVVEEHQERDNYAFLHSKELASRPSTVYSLADVASDLADKGIAVFMSRGGYFAGAVVRESPMRAVLHKGLRAYISRRGQGHRQSKHTSAQGGKKSRSAGGQLRAYNEEKHKNETVAVLEAWKDELEKVSLIWIAAPGHNRDLYIKHLAHVKDKIRFVPISTKRPSLAEAMRIAKSMTTVVREGAEEEEGEEEQADSADNNGNDDEEDDDDNEQSLSD